MLKNQDFFKNLAEKKQNGKLSNAILFFCDDEETTKRVLILAALMLEYPSWQLLDEESAQFKRVENSADLDIKTYPKGQRLLVADSNEIVMEAYVKPVNLPLKIFLINSIDDATEEAQNKLLKVLEEPPINVMFLLSAKSETKVLPTIKSRCEKIAINPLSMGEMKSFCSNALALALGSGYIGKTLAFDRKENLEEIADFAISILTKMKNSKEVVKFSKQFLDFSSEIDLILLILSIAIEDLIKIKCESESLCKLSMYKQSLKQVEAEYTVRALCEISKLLARLREKMEFNANLTMAIDNFLLKILEVKYLCK